MFSSDNKRAVIVILSAFFILLPLIFLLTHLSDPTSKSLSSNSDLDIKRAFKIDTTSALKLEQIRDTAFTPTDHTRIPWSFSSQTYWIKLEISNLSARARSLVIHFDNPMLDYLAIYDIRSTGSKLSYRGWDQQQSSLLDQSMFNYPVQLKPGQRIVLYSEIKTSGIAKTPIKIYDQADFVLLVRSTHLIWGAFIGILFMISLYNLLLYYGLKERIFLIYIGYIASTLLMMSVVQGFGHYLLPSSIYGFLRTHIINVNFSTLIFAVLFALFFLGYHKTKEALYQYSVYYIYALLTLCAITFFIPENNAAPLFFIALALAYPLCFWLLLHRYNSHQFWSTLYLVSWVPLLIAAAIQPLELTDQIPYSFQARNIYTLGILIEVILMAMALSERVRCQKELSIHNATHDLESGLPNRHALQDSLKSRLEHKEYFTLCLLEIDGLDSLSPYLSQEQGDKLINHLLDGAENYVAPNPQFLNISRGNKRPHKVARINESLFALVLQEHLDERIINRQLTPLLQIISDVISLSNLSISLNARFGYYPLSNHHLHFSTMLKKASQALAAGAREGVTINAFDAQRHYSLTLANDLKQALSGNQLTLFHQPQIDLKTGAVHGSEGLLRWHHDNLGKIPVETIISLAEDTGLINQLTLWVIERACQDLNQLHAQGYPAHHISVNISASDVVDKHFLNNVTQIVRSYDIPPQRLNLELTESVMISDYAYLEFVMRGLSKLGISVSIDDYGTGYSSLSHILQLPFHELKIDRIFVFDMEHSQKNRNIVKTTIEMAKLLNLKVVAEGVENQAVAQILANYQCDLSQGYFYTRPLNFNKYLLWLDSYTKTISSVGKQ